jgi:hypothetical protein
LDRSEESKKIIILFLVGLFFSVMFSWVLTRQESVLIRSDHFSRWYATHMLVAQHRSIYDPRNGQEVVSLNPIPYDPIEGSFFYPATLLVFTLPLATLPYPQAHFIWVVLIQIFMLAGIGLIYRETHWPGSANRLAVLVLLSMFFIPNLQNTIWGQFNTIGFLSLALVYTALQRDRYGLAGVLAAGLTFKPQNMLLVLLFLLFWASFKRKRWPLLLGFGLSSFGLWLFAELLEPDWVMSFLRGVGAYAGYLHPRAVLDGFGLPVWLWVSLMVGIGTWMFLKAIHAAPQSAQFAGCLVASLAIWWLSVPALGMMDLAALPLPVMLLLSSWKKIDTRIYRLGVYSALGLYFLGIAGFIYGLSNAGLYGVHILLSELAYKAAFPILLILLAVPMILSGWGEKPVDIKVGI